MVFVYCGDGRNNMANALMIGAQNRNGFSDCSSKNLFPDQNLVNKMPGSCSVEPVPKSL